MKPRAVISITGNTATGTTTLTKRLSQLVGWEPIYSEEYINRSPFFADFLQHPARLAFRNQVFFITEYVEAYLSITQNSKSDGQIMCMDYMIWELLIYSNALIARGFLTEDEHRVLTRLFHLLEPLLSIPNAVVFLTAGLDTLIQRISSRGRSAEIETGLDKSYLEELQLSFGSFISLWTQSPIIKLDSENTDFFNDNVVAAIAEEISTLCGIDR